MPLYQYRCTKCGHEFELLTTIDKRNEARCPKCGEKAERGWMGKAAFGPMKYTEKTNKCEDCPHQCSMHG